MVEVDGVPGPHLGRTWCTLVRCLGVAWAERRAGAGWRRGLAWEELGSCKGAPGSCDARTGELRRSPCLGADLVRGTPREVQRGCLHAELVRTTPEGGGKGSGRGRGERREKKEEKDGEKEKKRKEKEKEKKESSSGLFGFQNPNKHPSHIFRNEVSFFREKN